MIRKTWMATGSAALLWLVAPAWAAVPQLPPEIQADRYLLRAEEQLQEQDFAGAKETMDLILELQQEQDLELPVEFFFRYAQGSEGAGMLEDAIEYATRYLTEAGRDGEHYVEALRLLNTLEAENRMREALVRRISPVLDEMEFVWIPAGEFRMGSRSQDAHRGEQPVTRVRITEGFWLAKYEVTQEEWTAVMGSNPSDFSGCARCPVENVSWEDIQQFSAHLNAVAGANHYRLPTEAEWEYAARAGTTADRYGDLDEVAWWSGNSGRRTHPVGLKPANRFGLHDMLGNVTEWVQDWKGDYPGGFVTDPQGPGSGRGRISRGGYWNSVDWGVRASSRGLPTHPGSRSDDTGCRLLRTR